MDIDIKTAIILCMLSLSLPCLSAPKTGYFIDAPVTGLHYKTSSDLQGTTHKGAYQYNDGDIVTFYLGNDDSSMVLASISSQELITPTLATTTPSRSINMTRLLLSLDSSPENPDEILLTSKVLSKPEFQKKLKKIDLSALDNYKTTLGLNLVSAAEAARHLSQSQRFIEENFTSDKIILRPLNTVLVEDSIARRDWRGNLCFFDVSRIDEPDYYGPIGRLKYKLTPTGIFTYPSIGDYFGSDDGSVSSCELNTKESFSTQEFEAVPDYEKWGGILACAKRGCTRNDLNGFSVDEHDDIEEWKYRTIAMNYDQKTGIFMQKTQGLGPNKNVHHLNRSEKMWFTSSDARMDNINLAGIWQLKDYHPEGDIQYACLLIMHGSVFRTSSDSHHCPKTLSLYTEDVSQSFADMWWLHSGKNTASLAQLNTPVKWHTSDGKTKYTSWEYLPAGDMWDKGLLYRLQQRLKMNRSGVQKAETIRISELKKIER
ncbi:chromosome partitioning protein ParA [Vibrio albus]|uniref:Chromosome partitioning protein ParA n=1 Tax=Vibrio albus TaxID=2200953 RepID=A0A2U3B885_9VIBR|nr:chromosome partitioning protein ParA [Vibrio albus]PWI32977.1 chromosome partitioning protein ParA [Vibrio albus]